MRLLHDNSFKLQFMGKEVAKKLGGAKGTSLLKKINTYFVCIVEIAQLIDGKLQMTNGMEVCITATKREMSNSTLSYCTVLQRFILKMCPY